MDENLANLNPTTTREWLVYISGQLDDIKESAAEDREVVADYMKKTDSWIKCHDDNLAISNTKTSMYFERVDNLVPQVRGWTLVNSIAALAAMVMGYLGLK
jgi:hypothetical protein